MRNAIINYINACADRKRPCVHEWELLDKTGFYSKLNIDNIWKVFTYRCTKCCESKKVGTNSD